MSYTQDGNFNAAAQDGAKQISLPFQASGNFYAKEYVRKYKAVATAYYPIRNIVTSYTNVLLQSEALDQSPWSASGVTVNANSANNPIDGASTGDALIETAATSVHHVSQSSLAITATNVVFSCYLKAAGRNFAALTIQDSVPVQKFAFFDLSLGTVLSFPADGSASIKNMGNSWFLCTVTVAVPAAGNATGYISLSPDGATFFYAGNTALGIYAFGACMENATTPIPYIVTTSATRTVTVPIVDLDDPVAFLVDETAPESSALETGIAQWARVYANVPAPIVRYSTISINKPSPVSLGGTIAGTIYSSTLFSTTASIVFYSPNLFANNQIYSRTLPLCGSAKIGSNTRLSFNTPHGIAGNEVILPLRSSGASRDWIVFQASDYSVVSTTILDLLNLNFTNSIVEVAKYVRAYTPGPARVQTKNTKTFYLPGYTAGVSTPTDIPVPTPLINDAAFLPAIVGQTSGYLTYDASPLDFWMAPIYQQEVIQINAANL